MALSAAITTPETLRLLSQLLARRPLELGDSYAHVLHGVGKQLMLPAIKGWGHVRAVNLIVAPRLPVAVQGSRLAAAGRLRTAPCPLDSTPPVADTHLMRSCVRDTGRLGVPSSVVAARAAAQLRARHLWHAAPAGAQCGA
jgi:hypothetical protein